MWIKTVSLGYLTRDMHVVLLLSTVFKIKMNVLNFLYGSKFVFKLFEVIILEKCSFIGTVLRGLQIVRTSNRCKCSTLQTYCTHIP